MKRNFFLSLLCLLGILSTEVTSAQIADDFNSRPSVRLHQLKAYLQDHCSLYSGFNVNADGWNPGIEGDGAMVSENTPSPSYAVSPVLVVNSSTTISFSYKFNNTLGSGDRRWFKILLADENNLPRVLLDSIEFENIHTDVVYIYSKKLPAPTGNYKVMFSYNGIGGSAAIAVDQLRISSPRLYNTGCNSTPVAANDRLTGFSDHSATGVVTANDSDPEGEQLSAYLIKPSPDGKVALNSDGSFTFTPNAGFKGSSTSFTYKLCDGGYGVLCSNDATVSINFPSSKAGILPLSLIDFNGFYKNQGKVELNWVTISEQNTEGFDIERSFDGTKWEKVGALKTEPTSSSKQTYHFIDDAGRNRAIKKDLYYRLKQIGLDNKSAYSRIMIVRVYNTPSTKMISVTPNPAKNDIGVNVQLNESSFVVMKVLNGNGTEVLKKSLKANAGSNSYLLEGTSKLQSGMYMLEVIVNSKERMIVKLMKES